MEPSDLEAWLKFFAGTGGDWRKAIGFGDAAFHSYTLPAGSWYSREFKMGIIPPDAGGGKFYRVLWEDSKDGDVVRVESVPPEDLTVKIIQIMQRNNV